MRVPSRRNSSSAARIDHQQPTCGRSNARSLGERVRIVE